MMEKLNSISGGDRMTERKRATLAEVAALAGVSKTAASIALRGGEGARVSAATAERVRQAGRQLDYRPNLTARSLTTNSSSAIGLVSEFAATQRFGSGLIRGAIRAASGADHVVLIIETTEDPAETKRVIDVLLDHNVDGIVYAATRSRELDLPLKGLGTPFVALNAWAGDAAPSVVPDEFHGSRDMLTSVLATRRLDDVVIVVRSSRMPRDAVDSVSIDRRMSGLHAALSAHGIAAPTELHLDRWDPDAARSALGTYLATAARPPQLVIGLNDRISAGVYRALGDNGLTVSQDVSVLSFDDDDIAEFLDPTLTTLALPYEDMGALAVQLILTGNLEPKEHLVAMPCRYRNSLIQAESAKITQT